MIALTVLFDSRGYPNSIRADRLAMAHPTAVPIELLIVAGG